MTASSPRLSSIGSCITRSPSTSEAIRIGSTGPGETGFGVDTRPVMNVVVREYATSQKIFERKRALSMRSEGSYSL